MNIQFQFTRVSEVLKEDLKQYSLKRFEHLEHFLQTFEEDNKQLHIRIEHQEKHNVYDVRCTLDAGGSRFFHEEQTHEPKEAIDRSEANLIRQAKKHLELLREREKENHKTLPQE